MPTSPFSAGLAAKLAEPTAWRFDSTIGDVFTPRFFCCTNPNDLGISEGKAPTAIISPLWPNHAYVGETVDYGGTFSYDPDGSIASYAWTFEDHTPSSGTAATGTLNYGTAGVYFITLTVTDGTGLQSTPARIQLVVLPVQFQAFIATSSGVFYTDTFPPAWVDKNTGLSGDDLITYDVKIDPATQNLNAAEKTVWRCGKGGIQVSIDGGAIWHDKTPTFVSNVWGDYPFPVVSDLTFRQFTWAGNVLFVFATWQNSLSEWRSNLYYCSDTSGVRSNPSAQTFWAEVAE